MSRITSPGVKLTLNGEEYELRLDFTAMADFEKVAGRGVLEVVGEVFSALQGAKDANLGTVLSELSLKASELQALVWACLGGEDQELSLREAGRLIGSSNLQAVIGALAEALRVALPAAPEGEQSHPPAQAAASGPAGLPSGASGDTPSDSAKPTSGTSPSGSSTYSPNAGTPSSA